MNHLLANIIVTVLSILAAILLVDYTSKVEPGYGLRKLLIALGILMSLIGVVLVAK